MSFPLCRNKNRRERRVALVGWAALDPAERSLYDMVSAGDRTGDLIVGPQEKDGLQFLPSDARLVRIEAEGGPCPQRAAAFLIVDRTRQIQHPTITIGKHRFPLKAPPGRS